MKLSIKEIKVRALEILEAEVSGIRWADIISRIITYGPETPVGTIKRSVRDLFVSRSDILKIARGTYQLARYASIDSSYYQELIEESTENTGVVSSISLTEQDFYKSFAVWLEENDEATSAASLGGSSFGGKWGTPDVIGVLKPRAQDIFKFEPQIIAAEIKAVPGQPVVAFGQAVAYRLFCHKSYIVVPNTTGKDDMDRLKSLCSIHGVGLVTFTLNAKQPDYVVIVLPAVATPDMFYVNTMLEKLKAGQPELLNKLF